MSIATHFACLMLGGLVGFAAAAICAASGGGIVTCKHCKHSKIEKHTGDETLTCWLRSYGVQVPADHFCSFGEVAE